MEQIIFTRDDGETLSLTTDSPASSYGLPVLRYSGCTCPDMGPADTLCEHVWAQSSRDLFGSYLAAEVVCRYMTPFTQEMSRKFLQQWPAGPQR